MYGENVFDYIIAEKAAYKTRKVPITDGYEWNMFEHIRKSFLYKHSKFSTGNDDGNRPFKNIILPVLRVAYRSEGFDVKDIVPFVNERQNYYKSFLVKKYHPKWARKYSIDTFIDEGVESYVDYGLWLAKNVNEKRPETVPLQRIAFCDQTDILSGPLCEMHPMSPDQLMEYSGKWYDDVIEMAINQSKNEKPVITDGEKKAETPGQYIEVYELHGVLPAHWLNHDNGDKREGDAGWVAPEYDHKEYTRQMHVVVFYTGDDQKKKGLCLYKGKEKENPYMAKKRDGIYGRACGFGGIEELFEPQTWVNYSEIQIKEMLDVASMMIIKTNDPKFAQRNNITDLQKGEIVELDEDKEASQLTIQPYNKAQFDQATKEWEARAMVIGSASEGSLGKNPSSGTPFALQDLIVQEGNGAHEYRQGQLAVFMAEIEREWILPWLVDEMNEGQTFLDELSLDELQYVADQVLTNEINDRIKAKMLLPGMKAEMMTQEGADSLRQVLREEFMKAGPKRFLELMKDELRDIPIDVDTNIVGKQKDLAEMAAKLTNIFRAVIADPSVLQHKGMGDLFNQIIEASGFNPIDFSSFTATEDQEKEAAPKGASSLPTPVPERELAAAA